MIRAVLIFAVAASGAALVVWLADNPGWITADWMGFRLEGPMSILTVYLAAIFVALYGLMRLLSIIVRGPAAGRNFFTRRRAEAGKGALTQGLAAAAAGDATGALRHAARAERLVKEDPLARVLALEAAELEGRDCDVETLARGLVEQSETELLGRRALFDLARKSGNSSQSTVEAEAAFETHPGAGWAAEALLVDAIAKQQWDRARSVMTRAARNNAFQNGRADAIRPALMLAEALYLNSRGENAKAQILARKAHDSDVRLTAAGVFLAEHFLDAGKLKRARECVEQFWPVQPHPALGRVFAELEPEETREERLERVQNLVSTNPDHIESRLLFAEHAIAARNIPAARDALKALLEAGTSSRAFVHMAALERVEHGAAATPEDWIERALAAPRDGLWVCSACGHRAAGWSPVCGRCERLASAVWATHQDRPGAVIAPASRNKDAEKADAISAPKRALLLEGELQPGAEEGSGKKDALRQPDDPGTDKTVKAKGEAAW